MATTLVVCENPWTNRKGRFARWSMRPFVEGICELNQARLIYRTFSTRAELTTLLGGGAFDDTTGRTVVYIAGHGNGGRLSLGRNGDGGANLATVAQWLCKGVEGVWLGCCDLGSSRSLKEFLKYGGAVWAGGYECAVDWAPSMLVDIAVLQELTASTPIVGRRGALRVFKRALTGFSPTWVVGANRNEGKANLGGAIRIVARDRVQGARVEDISQELRDRLSWNGQL
jgi:hypothetical protein